MSSCSPPSYVGLLVASLRKRYDKLLLRVELTRPLNDSNSKEDTAAESEGKPEERLEEKQEAAAAKGLPSKDASTAIASSKDGPAGGDDASLHDLEDSSGMKMEKQEKKKGRKQKREGRGEKRGKKDKQSKKAGDQADGDQADGDHEKRRRIRRNEAAEGQPKLPDDELLDLKSSSTGREDVLAFEAGNVKATP